MKKLTVFVLLIALAACTSTVERESFGEYVDNSVITAKVKSGLFDDPITKGFEINVRTYKGVVQLSGFVSTRKERRRAGDEAGLCRICILGKRSP